MNIKDCVFEIESGYICVVRIKDEDSQLVNMNIKDNIIEFITNKIQPRFFDVTAASWLKKSIKWENLTSLNKQTIISRVMNCNIVKNKYESSDCESNFRG
jgi:hypothetical protein